MVSSQCFHCQGLACRLRLGNCHRHNDTPFLLLLLPPAGLQSHQPLPALLLSCFHEPSCWLKPIAIRGFSWEMETPGLFCLGWIPLEEGK